MNVKNEQQEVKLHPAPHLLTSYLLPLTSYLLPLTFLPLYLFTSLPLYLLTFLR